MKKITLKATATAAIPGNDLLRYSTFGVGCFEVALAEYANGENVVEICGETCGISLLTLDEAGRDIDIVLPNGAHVELDDPMQHEAAKAENPQLLEALNEAIEAGEAVRDTFGKGIQRVLRMLNRWAILQAA